MQLAWRLELLILVVLLLPLYDPIPLVHLLEEEDQVIITVDIVISGPDVVVDGAVAEEMFLLLLLATLWKCLSLEEEKTAVASMSVLVAKTASLVMAFLYKYTLPFHSPRPVSSHISSFLSCPHATSSHLGNGRPSLPVSYRLSLTEMLYLCPQCPAFSLFYRTRPPAPAIRPGPDNIIVRKNPKCYKTQKLKM